MKYRRSVARKRIQSIARRNPSQEIRSLIGFLSEPVFDDISKHVPYLCDDAIAKSGALTYKTTVQMRARVGAQAFRLIKDNLEIIDVNTLKQLLGHVGITLREDGLWRSTEPDHRSIILNTLHEMVANFHADEGNSNQSG